MRFEGKLKVDGRVEAEAMGASPDIVASTMGHYFSQYFEDFTNFDNQKKITMEIKRINNVPK